MTSIRTPIAPSRVVNFTSLLSLFSPMTTSLAPARRKQPTVQVVRRREVAAGLIKPRRSRTASANLRKIDVATFPVTRAAGSFFRASGTGQLESLGMADLALPPGIARFTNVATLKKMLRAERSDVLLRRVADRWEVCPDSMRIDLADDSAMFRLGPIEIYS